MFDHVCREAASNPNPLQCRDPFILRQPQTGIWPRLYVPSDRLPFVTAIVILPNRDRHVLDKGRGLHTIHPIPTNLQWPWANKEPFFLLVDSKGSSPLKKTRAPLQVCVSKTQHIKAGYHETRLARDALQTHTHTHTHETRTKLPFFSRRHRKSGGPLANLGAP